MEENGWKIAEYPGVIIFTINYFEIDKMQPGIFFRQGNIKQRKDGLYYLINV